MKIKKIFNPEDCFFTADCHFKHDNVIKYCNRPYTNADEMDIDIIQKWNDAVKNDSNIFVAGDFIHSGNLEYIKDILSNLNGKIWLIMGNHCYKNKFDRNVVIDMFQGRVYDTLSITVKDDLLEDNTRLFICHYPMYYWERNSIMLHGHIHSGPNSNSTEIVSFHPYRYDIGMDNNDFKPISYFELKDIINKQVIFNNEKRGKK